MLSGNLNTLAMTYSVSESTARIRLWIQSIHLQSTGEVLLLGQVMYNASFIDYSED